MIFINSYINDYYNQIINILSNPIYNISTKRLYYIQKLFKATNIYHINNKASMITIPLRDYTNNYYSSITIKNSPQVIDVPPIYFINSFIALSPILVLNSDLSNILDWTIIHELSHLFSIGKYILIKNKYNFTNQLIHHTFGINNYLYQIEKNELKILSSEKHNGMNELITDFITWHFMQTIYNAEITPIYKGIESFYNFITNNCIKYNTVEKFIGWYFSGNTKQIKKYLLNDILNDYEQLYSNLETYH